MSGGQIDDNALYGTFELSALWHVKPRTIRRWVASGRLKAHTPKWSKGHMKITGKEVKRFVREEIEGERDGK